VAGEAPSEGVFQNVQKTAKAGDAKKNHKESDVLVCKGKGGEWKTNRWGASDLHAANSGWGGGVRGAGEALFFLEKREGVTSSKGKNSKKYAIENLGPRKKRQGGGDYQGEEQKSEGEPSVQRKRRPGGESTSLSGLGMGIVRKKS